jgi:hypothetical protein
MLTANLTDVNGPFCQRYMQMYIVNDKLRGNADIDGLGVSIILLLESRFPIDKKHIITFGLNLGYCISSQCHNYHSNWSH